MPGARAALRADATPAAGTRRWNDAKVLALSLRATTAALAGELLEAFFGSRPDAAELGTVARVEVP